MGICFQNLGAYISKEYPTRLDFGGPAWGMRFLHAVVAEVARVCVFDVVFPRRLPEGPERCPAEGGSDWV